MHDWSDDSVDWKGIGKACDVISDTCNRWGRFGGHIKEKWGTIRFDVRFSSHVSLHDLIYPGYHYNQFPSWLYWIDQNIFSPVATFLFGNLFFWWQKKVYNFAYQRALKKFPHLRAEILHDASQLDLIQGASRKEGKNIHILGWNGETLTTWTTYDGT